MNRRGLWLLLTVACSAAAVPHLVALGAALGCGAIFAGELAAYFVRERRYRRTVRAEPQSVPEPPDCGAVAEPIPGFSWTCLEMQGHEGPHHGYGLEWS